DPEQTKTYAFPAGTEIYVADRKQEAFAMKGNDIKASGQKPTFILAERSDTVRIILSTLGQVSKEGQPLRKER
ncbi:MAG TPA: hypothetical protein VHK69_20400, partial [Chitinophagaceae bacterium]|nr:hypothetical protein [Chitinophagaceae bacterium]